MSFLSFVIGNGGGNLSQHKLRLNHKVIRQLLNQIIPQDTAEMTSNMKVTNNKTVAMLIYLILNLYQNLSAVQNLSVDQADTCHCVWQITSYPVYPPVCSTCMKVVFARPVNPKLVFSLSQIFQLPSFIGIIKLVLSVHIFF